jgi:hypothetical protein
MWCLFVSTWNLFIVFSLHHNGVGHSSVYSSFENSLNESGFLRYFSTRDNSEEKVSSNIVLMIFLWKTFRLRKWGKAKLGKAKLGKVKLGTVKLGKVKLGKVRLGKVKLGKA